MSLLLSELTRLQFRTAASLLVFSVLFGGTGFTSSFAEPVGPAMPMAASTEKDADDKTANALPAGAEEYNKGCELFSIAKIQAEKGNVDGEKQLLKEALKHFEIALTQNPKLTEAQSNIGFVYLTRRDYRKAIETFNKALAINPHHVNSFNGLATAYAFQGDIKRATETFDKLTTLAPGSSEYYFNKGSVLQKAGKFAEAQKAYGEALRIQPNNQFALFNMGTLLENQGKLEEAKPYYEKAKGVEIGNTAGLEAIHRLEAIQDALKKKH